MVTKRSRERWAGPSTAALGLAPQEQCLPSCEREATSDVEVCTKPDHRGEAPSEGATVYFLGTPLLKKLQEDVLDRKRRLKREEGPRGETSSPHGTGAQGQGSGGRPGRRRHKQKYQGNHCLWEKQQRFSERKSSKHIASFPVEKAGLGHASREGRVHTPSALSAGGQGQLRD